MKIIKTIPALPVHNIDKGTKFYEDKFGFTCRHKDDGFSKLVRDEIEIHLWASCDRNWKWRSIFLFLKPIWSGAETFIAGTHSCRIQVIEIDKFYNEFKKTNVLYNSKTLIEKTNWGTREFPALDLHGNLLTFFERIE
jgi:catechol 2,3-dioxygenase-like lactoylglutathione lyase family enzyme